MRKHTKRFFSMLMALLLVVSLLPAGAVAAEETNPVQDWNVTLSDQICTNFYLTLDAPESTTVKFTVGGKTTTVSASDATQKDGCYVFSVDLAAAQMTDPITLEVVSGGVSVFSKDYTVKAYAEEILKGEYDDEEKTMVLTMLHYGAAAQKALGYRTESLANAGCAELEKANIPASGDVEEMACTGSVSGIRYYGASLVFASRVAVRYYFALNAGDITDYRFQVGESTYTPVQKSGLYYVEIGNIYPQNLDKQYTLTVSKADESLSVSYGPMNYIVRQYHKAGTSDDQKALVQMLYTYHLAAIEYAKYDYHKAFTPTSGGVAELHMELMQENGSSFITKRAYAAGSTITFKAYQPDITDNGNHWWGVGYTTGSDKNDIYSTCAKNSLYQVANVGYWSEYTVTLPSDGGPYYIYIGGAKNSAWADKPLLVTDVSITEPGQNAVTDSFEYGLNAGLFNTGANAVTWQLIGDITPTSGYAVAIAIDKINERGTMSFVTKDTYPAGSVISFKAYQPNITDENNHWWGVGYTTGSDGNDIYTCTQNNLYDAEKVGKWNAYTVTLPVSGGPYYIYFGGAKNETWADKPLLIDDVLITAPDGTQYTDDFENGVSAGLFDVNGNDVVNAHLLGEIHVTVQEALEDLKASYGTEIANGTTLPSTWTVKGNEFTVAWSVSNGGECAKIVDGKLILTSGSESVSYVLTATVSADDESASYSWLGTVKPISGNVAAIKIDILNENSPMSFITKATYPGGSTVSFKAYVPEGASWWAVSWATDPANTGLYKWTEGMGKNMTSVTGEWETYSVTLPDDGNTYYVYIVGEKGQWKGNALLLDDVVITAPDGTQYTDDFEKGVSAGLFNAGAAVSDHTIGSTTDWMGNVIELYIDYINDNAGDGMNLITAEAYPGGSTIEFDAYVPEVTVAEGESAPWWAVRWTTDPADVDLYSGSGKSMSSKTGEWATYSVTLPDDGQKYYVYFVGAKSEWGIKNDEPLAIQIDNVTITTNGTTVTEDFEKGLDDTIFALQETDKSGNTAIKLRTYNYAAQLSLGKIPNGLGFITKSAYPAGSTVSFDAYVPENANWWAVDWTTSADLVNSEDSRYAHSSGNGVDIKYIDGIWSNYTLSLPTDGGPYHVYIVGAGEWYENVLQVDNFKVTDADGKVLAEENFNRPLTDTIFSYSNLVSVKQISGYRIDDAAKIRFTAYAAPTTDLKITNDSDLIVAYSKLAEAGFNKAIALYEGYAGSAAGATNAESAKTLIAEYSAKTAEIAKTVMRIAQRYGITYYVKDWTLYGMGGSQTDEYGFSATAAKNAGIDNTLFQSIIKDTILNSEYGYGDNAGYAGHFGFDEPYYADLEKVGLMAKAYSKSGLTQELFVNLLPPYINKNSPQLGAENKWNQWFGDFTYEKYLNEYLNQTNGYLDYICWDYYPFLQDKSGLTDEQTLRTQKYLYSYELMANKAKENDRELRVIVQTSGDSVGVRDLNGKSELNFQINSGLAFGVKEFIYYQYSGNGESGYKYIHNYNDQTYSDDLYSWAKEINTNVHTFEEIYDQYIWSGVMKVDEGNSNVMLKNLTGAVTTHDAFKVEGDGAFLVGIFEGNESVSYSRNNAFMLVNAESDPNAQSRTVVLTMSGASAVAIYRNGESTITRLNDTQCTISDIEPGEGIFIIPIK